MYAYILLTDSGTLPSKLVKWWTGDCCTHAAISLDSPLLVYSFGRKCRYNFLKGGFIETDLTQSGQLDMPIKLLRLPLSRESYRQARAMLAHFQHNGDQYRYNFLGILGYIMHRKLNQPHAYFCSQFVSMVLERSGACSLMKPACFVKPADLLELKQAEVVYEGSLIDYLTDGLDTHEPLPVQPA
ncbi:hypothetical protein M3N64_12445 [Sporolactobacillus sp. CPB3-1]|uniref:Uncharacterized protein n=1 Tax=Sporolactobacillus mangiferae TaxID=2940498 RepID=A0ABT0MCX6_9BACL|nr:hypothetical protein [Sporolactobacillus mangiferae]MCL1632729.1 hypothetical protein [Sporolactobacillus mangiferae]